MVIMTMMPVTAADIVPGTLHLLIHIIQNFAIGSVIRPVYRRGN